MDHACLSSFLDELHKLAAPRGVGELLSNLAQRSGIRPSLIPSIQQVKHVAAKPDGRQRAAEIALNVRNYLKSNAGKAAA